MKSLPVSVREEFVQQSHWVVSKTHRKFSAMPFDQAHEQENKTVKGPGGAVGLTENPSAFRRWMLSGPEMARLLKEFEEEYIVEDDTHCLHHEQSDSTQNKFHRQVLSLTDTIKQMGNPFTDDCQELVALDTRIMVHIQHAVDQGAKTLLVRTVDTDVVVILVGLYFQLVTNQQLCDLWVAFGMGKNSDSIISTTYVRIWANHDQEPYQCSMLFLDAIRHPHSTGKERSQRGKLGRYIPMSQQHLPTWPGIRSRCWMWTQMTFKRSRDLQFYCTTNAAICFL